MRKLVLSAIGLLTLSAIIYSCSKSDDSEPDAIEKNEYYSDSSGKYVAELGEEGYNIYENGKPYESDGISNKTTKVENQTADIRKEYQYNYKGICIFPPGLTRKNNTLISSLPNKQATPGKKNITCNFKALGGGYRVAPKPAFLGGSKYSCYECLVSGIAREDYYLGVCNGTVFISGALVDDPSFQSIKNSFSQINFNPNETEQFIQSISSSGLYNCTKRN